MIKYLTFVNPPLTFSGLPHANCMIFKPKPILKDYNLCNGDLISMTIRDNHYAKVLEAKRNKLNNTLINFFKPKPRVQSVVYPN